MLQLYSNLDDFVCQFKEGNDLLKSQFLEVKQNLEQLLDLPQKFKQVEYEVQTLKREVADLKCSPAKSQEYAKPPPFFGALERNVYFTGRTKELENLVERFFGVSDNMPESCGLIGRKANVHGICGLGGCGKSSLAFEYAWHNLERYPGGVYVVNGESDNSMRASFQKLFALFVNDLQPNHIDESKQFDQLMTVCLSWLGNVKDRWLLIVDNMDQQELSHYAWTLFLGQWKANSSGDILVTSRRNARSLCEDLDLSSDRCFELNPFALGESVEFLKKRTGLPFCREEQNQEEKELALELDGLPLALEQAAAHIKALKCPIISYLQQYRSQKWSLLNAKSVKPLTEIYSKERLAVQTTWLLNFSSIENDEKDQELGKAASFFMKMAAYLCPDSIPLEVINSGSPEIKNEYLKKRLKMPIGDKQIVDLLVRLSLFKQNLDGTLSIHRLVQETLRGCCDSEGVTHMVLSSATRILHRAFLDCKDGPYSLNPHTQMKWKDEACKNGVPFSSLLTDHSRHLEAKRWKNLSLNAFSLCWYLLEDSCLKPPFFCEETSRLFCEAAYYCYSLRMERLGNRLHQLALEVICAVEDPVSYDRDDLMKITRIPMPFVESSFLSMCLGYFPLNKELCDKTFDLHFVETPHEKLERAAKAIMSEAKDAFIRGDFHASANLYTEIVKMSGFGDNIRGNFDRIRSHFVHLGEILCSRGIAHIKMENLDIAVNDFNAATCVDIQHYRAYYWKTYALCKLVQSGKTEFTSRAQAAVAILHLMFANSKSGDIEKLRIKFPGLFVGAQYTCVSHVSQLKKLETLSVDSNSFFVIILAGGCYDLRKLVVFGGRYCFVGLPGTSVLLNCISGVCLSQGSFLFENIEFVTNQLCDSKTLESLTLTGRHRTNTSELASEAEKTPIAAIEANNVKSLVIAQCQIKGLPRYSGIVINNTQLSDEQRSVVVRSSQIKFCSGPGLQINDNTPFCHISIQCNNLHSNLYGVVIDSPSHFNLEKNYISGNNLSGVVVVGASEGKLKGNTLYDNGKHGIFLNKTNAVLEGNVCLKNLGWGVLCCGESNLDCKENVLEDNLFGGLRTLLNGKGKVSIQRCEFRGNNGPAVFPTAENELSRLELDWKQSILYSRKNELLYLSFFLEGTLPNCGSIGEFNSPVQMENKVSDVCDLHFHIVSDFCSSCSMTLQEDSEMVECSRCRIARYCSDKCSESATAVHYPVCQAILEANKYVNSVKEFCTLSSTSLYVQDNDQNSSDVFLCVIASLSLAPGLGPRNNYGDPDTFSCQVSLVACRQRNLWTWIGNPIVHRFVLTHGVHIPDRVADVKAACVLASFDHESEVTVYTHRIFPLEKVPNALNLVDETLRSFKELLTSDFEAPKVENEEVLTLS